MSVASSDLINFGGIQADLSKVKVEQDDDRATNVLGVSKSALSVSRH